MKIQLTRDDIAKILSDRFSTEIVESALELVPQEDGGWSIAVDSIPFDKVFQNAPKENLDPVITPRTEITHDDPALDTGSIVPSDTGGVLTLEQILSASKVLAAKGTSVKPVETDVGRPLASNEYADPPELSPEELQGVRSGGR